MQKSIDELPPMVYPYHVGPKIRHFSTSLLFYGKLGVSLAAWPMGDPIDAFLTVGGRANHLNDRLLDLFNFVLQQFDIVQEVAVNELDHLAPLGDKISKAITIYPGTPEHYTAWEPYHEKCLQLASRSLENVHILSAATTDFIFSVYELIIIHDGDPDLVLRDLNARASLLGDEFLLLAECALNRYTLPKTGKGTWITDSNEMLAILSHVAEGVCPSKDETAAYRSEALAFTLFDKLLSPYTPQLDEDGIRIINKITTDRSGELATLRKTVVHEAHDIITESPSERLLKSAVQASLFRIEKEVSSLVKINKSEFKELIKKLTEDRMVWATLAGFIGAASSEMPAELTATLGVATFASFVAGAAKARNESKKKLSDSPYAFIHYLNSEA